MLFIAQADHGQPVAQRDAVDLHAEAQRVADYFSIVGEEKGISIEVTGTIEQAVQVLGSSGLRCCDSAT